jgi:serine/threonine protein phosphatase PrpC
MPLPSRVLRLAAAAAAPDGGMARLQRLVRLALGGASAAAAAAASASAAATAAPPPQAPQPPLLPAPPPPAAPAPVNYQHHAAGAGAAVVSRVTYPANEPLEDRFDFRDSPAPRSPPAAAAPSPVGAEAAALPRMLACVMDGHGGWQAAEYARRQLLDAVERELELGGAAAAAAAAQGGGEGTGAGAGASGSESALVGAALARAFARVDRGFLAGVRPAFELGFGDVAHVGCCAIAAAVLPSAVVVANAGDCRAVLGRVHYPTAERDGFGGNEGGSSGGFGGSGDADAPTVPPELEGLPAPAFSALPDDGGLFSATPLSRDHNAREPREKARLAALHPGEADIVVCKVGNPSACYVKGRLQPTRSLGDAYLKESEFNVPAGLGRMWGRHIKAPYSPPYISG